MTPQSRLASVAQRTRKWSIRQGLSVFNIYNCPPPLLPLISKLETPAEEINRPPASVNFCLIQDMERSCEQLSSYLIDPTQLIRDFLNLIHLYKWKYFPFGQCRGCIPSVKVPGPPDNIPVPDIACWVLKKGLGSWESKAGSTRPTPLPLDWLH